jgi:hypothetical protein
MDTMFNQGLNINHLESDDCPSEGESDAPSLVPHYLAKSGLSSESGCDEFDDDLWDASEFTTHRCNSVKVSHIPSEPTINPHEYNNKLDNVTGVCIQCVTLSEENVFQPKSIHGDTVDLKQSKMSCESAQGDSTFQPSRTSRFRIPSHHNSTSSPHQQLQ